MLLYCCGFQQSSFKQFIINSQDRVKYRIVRAGAERGAGQTHFEDNASMELTNSHMISSIPYSHRLRSESVLRLSQHPHVRFDTLLYLVYVKIKKCLVSQSFWDVWRGWCWKPLCQLRYVFNPTWNRVKLLNWSCSVSVSLYGGFWKISLTIYLKVLL